MVMSDSPVSMHNPGNDAPSEAPAAPDAAAQKQMEQAYAQMKRKMAMAEIGKKIKHITEVSVCSSSSISVANFYCDGKCFIEIFFSLLIFAGGIKHSSEASACFSFSISVANFYCDGKCFIEIFFSLLIFTDAITDNTKSKMNRYFFSFVTNCFPDVERAFIELLCLYKPALCLIFVS